MPSWKKVITSGSDAILNSVSVTTNVVAQSFTGSLFGTASWAQNAISASRSVSSSYALTASFSTNLQISGSVNNVQVINFVTGSDQPRAEGRIGWDDGYGTLNLGLKGGNVNLAIGEELFVRAYNAESTTLTLGTVVYISGSQGNRVAVKRASATAELGSANTLGFVAESIAAGDEGFVQTEGPLNELNTLGLVEGALVYLSSSAGLYTTVAPQAPLHSVRLGYVERVHASVGSIYIKIDNGYEIEELHDVLVNNALPGDVLVRSGSLWVNSKQLTGSYGLTGSLTSTGGFTGSLFGTASNLQGGATNYIPLWNTATTLSSSVIYQSGGNVGIGTTNPANAKLEIVQTAASEGLRVDGSAGGFALVVQGGTSYKTSARLITVGGTYLTSTPPSNGAIIEGNVGIGTTSPSARLHVSGSTTTNLLVGTSDLFVSASGNVGIGTTSPTEKLTIRGNGAKVLIEAASSPSGYYTYLQANWDANNPFVLNSQGFDILGSRTATSPVGTRATYLNSYYDISLNTGAGTASLATSKLYISASGNVGIGTTSPNAKLDINGNTIVSGLLTVITGSAIELQVTNTGVRIGNLITDSHSITGSVSISGSVITTGSVSATNFTGSLFGTSSWTSNAVSSSFALTAVSSSFATSASQAQNANTASYILNAVSASFATTASNVLGGATNYIPLWNTATTLSSSVMYQSSGNVGIGTTSPGQKLEVAGIGRFTGANGFSIGGDTGQIRVQYSTTGFSRFTLLNAANSYTGLSAASVSIGNGYGDSAPPTSGLIVEGNVGIGTTSPSARLHVSGSTTTNLLVGTSDLFVSASGNVGIGTASPNAKLDVNGNTIITGSLTVITGSAIELQVLSNGVKIGNIISDTHTVTGSLNISGSVNVISAITASTLLVSGSGVQRAVIYGSGSSQPIFSVFGSQGELFSINDSLSGSLFSVNDISGLPILEVFSDDTVLMGDSVAPVLNTTKRVSIGASTTIYSMSTASYDGMFVEYTIRSGSSGRMGQFMSMWSGSSTITSDVSTVDFGNTSGVSFTAIVSGSNMVMTGSASSGTWTGKFIIRTI